MILFLSLLNNCVRDAYYIASTIVYRYVHFLVLYIVCCKVKSVLSCGFVNPVLCIIFIQLRMRKK